MGSRGEQIRTQIRTTISRADIRSTLTLTPITRTTGSEGGYNQPTLTTGTARTVYAIPANYVKRRVSFQKFGDLREGEIRFLIRDDETVDTDDRVTFESQTYHIREIKPIYFNEVTVAQSITLSSDT